LSYLSNVSPRVGIEPEVAKELNLVFGYLQFEDPWSSVLYSYML